MTTIALLKQYIESRQGLWSKTTIKSEAARLNKMLPLLDKTPIEVYRALSISKLPYTIKTTFIRLSGFTDWLISIGAANKNDYKTFLLNNPQLFRNAYKREELELDFETTNRLIDSIQNTEIKDHAKFLLYSGLRLSESYKVQAEGAGLYVIGKGGKKRRIFAKLPTKLVDASTLRRALNKLGLKPHSLRKLYATKLFSKDMAPQDLCKVMGWSSMQTALSYLQVKKEAQLASEIFRALNE